MNGSGRRAGRRARRRSTRDAVTRYVVELDSGERLVVVRQNLESSPVEPDARVSLHWRPEHTYELEGQ